MKHFRDRVICNFIYGGITKQEYQELREEVREKDRSSLCTTSLCLLLMFGGLFLGSLFFEMMAPNRVAYGGVGFAFLAIYIACRRMKKKGKWLIMPLWYLAMTVMFIYAIILNTVNRNDISATTFCLIMMAAPLLLLDMPWRVFLYFGLVTLVFIPIDFQKKPYHLAFTDTVNALCSIFLGSVIHLSIIRTKLREMMQRRYIEKQRDTDKLTGCLTKAAFEHKMKNRMKSEDEKGTLLVMDLDHFKKINDSYGHIFGDMVLHTMGEKIREIFPETALVGRFGGDEFQVWLPEYSSRRESDSCLNAMLSHMRNIQTPDDQTKISVSIGAAVYPDNGNTYEELFGNADAALYTAKSLGRNRYVFCPEVRQNKELMRSKGKNL